MGSYTCVKVKVKVLFIFLLIGQDTGLWALYKRIRSDSFCGPFIKLQKCFYLWALYDSSRGASICGPLMKAPEMLPSVGPLWRLQRCFHLWALNESSRSASICGPLMKAPEVLPSVGKFSNTFMKLWSPQSSPVFMWTKKCLGHRPTYILESMETKTFTFSLFLYLYSTVLVGPQHTQEM